MGVGQEEKDKAQVGEIRLAMRDSYWRRGISTVEIEILTGWRVGQY